MCCVDSGIRDEETRVFQESRQEHKDHEFNVRETKLEEKLVIGLLLTEFSGEMRNPSSSSARPSPSILCDRSVTPLSVVRSPPRLPHSAVDQLLSHESAAGFLSSQDPSRGRALFLEPQRTEVDARSTEGSRPPFFQDQKSIIRRVLTPRSWRRRMNGRRSSWRTSSRANSIVLFRNTIWFVYSRLTSL